jgi:hypothetical protein
MRDQGRQRHQLRAFERQRRGLLALRSAEIDAMLQIDRLAEHGIIFRETPPEHDIDWHPAPRRQYIINLDAGVKITASDGESRIIGTGEIILVEDTTGKGHLSQHIEGKIRHSVFVPIE